MDPEELADLTRNGEVLLTHPDLPGSLAPVMPESVQAHVNRGWEKYEPNVPHAEVLRRHFADLSDHPAEPPAGNASTDEWRDYARSRGVPDADEFSRDELRDRFTVIATGDLATQSNRE